jgi:hypothetical protein
LKAQYQKDYTLQTQQTKARDTSDPIYLINPDFTITSFSLRLATGEEDLSKTYAIYQKDTFQLRHNEHTNPEKGPKSNLIIFPEPVNKFYFHPGYLGDTIQFSFLNTTYRQSKKEPKKNFKRKMLVAPNHTAYRKVNGVKGFRSPIMSA